MVEVVEEPAEEGGRRGGQDEAVGEEGAVGTDNLHVGEPPAHARRRQCNYWRAKRVSAEMFIPW